MNIINKLSLAEKIILYAYTLFDISDASRGDLRKKVGKMTGESNVDLYKATQKLAGYGLMGLSTYNWQTFSYNQGISKNAMVSVMLHIYENDSKLVSEILSELTEMKPSKLQRMLWQFIISNFTKIGSRKAVADLLGTNKEVVASFFPDERFEPLVLCLHPDTFTSITQRYIDDLGENMPLHDTAYIRHLLGKFPLPEAAAAVADMTAQLDLYDYLAHGTRPDRLAANVGQHQVIAAFAEAYNGNYEKALGHMRLGASLINKKSKKAGSKDFFTSATLNFYYVVMARLVGTDDSHKRIVNLAKSGQVETSAASLLHEMLYKGITEDAIKERTNALVSNTSLVHRILGSIVGAYMGGLDPGTTLSAWLFFKNELRQWLPLEENDQKAADAAYATQGLLARIYRKPDWELVLDELMKQDGKGEMEERKDERIAYFMQDIDDMFVEPKLQTRLKSGRWSAGRVVSFYEFIEGNVRGMNDADRRIADRDSRGHIYYGAVVLTDVLTEIVGEDRLYLGRRAPYQSVEVLEDTPYITLQREGDYFKVLSNVPLKDTGNHIIITQRTDESITFLRLDDTQRLYYQRLLQLGSFPLEAESQLRSFLQTIGGKLEVNSDLIEGGSTLPIVDGSPMLIMQLRQHTKDIYAVSLFTRPLESGRKRCVPGKGDSVIVDIDGNGNRTRVSRDLKAEAANKAHFLKACPIGKDTDKTLLDTYSVLPLVSYAQQNPDRIVCEWPEGDNLRLKRRQKGTWNGVISKSEHGWFEIEGSVEIDQGHVVSMAQLLDLANQAHGRYIKLGENDFLELSESLRRQLITLDTVASRSRGRLQMSPFSAALLGPDILDGELQLKEAEELKSIRQRIVDASTYKARVPKTLEAELRPYQLEGYQWMSRLNKWGAGALLADDMGLGKTVQAIALMLAKAGEGPALVVAPASVAPNWKSELERFAPSLNAELLNFADSREQLIKKAKKGDVVVTTYGLLLSVKDDITKKKWTTVCLDEAHIVKNRGAKTSAVAMQLQGDYRIMLTGTPVQNHLAELWNLFQFVNPGLLGSFEDFKRRFINPIEQQNDKDAQQRLDRLVKPFMLRRTKEKVARELPEKEEIYQLVALSKDEIAIYELIRQRAEAMLMAEQGRNVSVQTLAELTRLRQCSCDPRLTKEGSKLMGSKMGTKIEALTELLGTIIDGLQADEKGNLQGGVLVFSQFTSYLALIKEALDKAKIPYLYIDGAVPIKERTKLVRKFQSGKCPVFLISLKAGGLGLNLTQANYVIHMDPWWNPAIEAQATDRTHRIGQKQAVTVYHLIAQNTIEEKIQRMHEQKRELVHNVLEGTDMGHKLTGEELLQMVKQ